METALMGSAPIVLFVCKRSGETRKVLESLRADEGGRKAGLGSFSSGARGLRKEFHPGILCRFMPNLLFSPRLSQKSAGVS